MVKGEGNPGSTGPVPKSAKTGKRDLNRIIAKHAIAWIMLLALGFVVWRMATPVLPRSTDTRTGNPAGAPSMSAPPVTPKKLTPATTTGERGTPTTIVPEPALPAPKQQKPMALPSGVDRVQMVADEVPIWEAPKQNSVIVGSLTKGTIVQVLSRDGEWIRVRTVDYIEGYISANPEFIRPAP